MMMNELLKKIKRTKSLGKKSDLYLSVYGEERRELLHNMIFSMIGTHTLPSLQDAVQASFGTFAGIDVTEKEIRGLACMNPERVKCSFTLGLNEVKITRCAC
jgi:hypothetical protein